MKRDLVNCNFINKAIVEVSDKINYRLDKKGYGIYASNHETYGIIAEEFNKELLDALHADDDDQFRSELIDIAVGAIFGIASMDTKKENENGSNKI